MCSRVRKFFLVIISISFLSFAILPVEAESMRLVRLQSESGPRRNLKKIYDRKLKRIRYFKDQVVVKFKQGANPASIRKYMALNNLEPIAKLGKRSYACKVMTLGDDDAVDNLMTTTSIEELVEYLDIDEYREIKTGSSWGRTLGARVSREPQNLFKLEWHLYNDGENGIKESADANIQEAWSLSKGSGVKIAVIDTGFDLKHPDINYDGIGYDVPNNRPGATAPLRSIERHGTAVAGVIAAKDDGMGVVGVAPESSIIPIRLLDDSGACSVSSIILAHQKAVELGAQIINNSWGSVGSEELTQLEKDLYKELYEEANNGKGVLVIFASGNARVSNLNYAPEARDSSTMAVGATDSSDKRAAYSNYGVGLDLVAPGGDSVKGILTTDRTDVQIKEGTRSKMHILGYVKGDTTNVFTGTSAAAPIVAGVAALVWSANPTLTAKQVREILNTSAKKLDAYEFDADGLNAEVGHGRVDAKAAVDLALTY